MRGDQGCLSMVHDLREASVVRAFVVKGICHSDEGKRCG